MKRPSASDLSVDLPLELSRLSPAQELLRKIECPKDQITAIRSLFRQAIALADELSEGVSWRRQRLYALLSPMYLEVSQEFEDSRGGLVSLNDVREAEPYHDELLLAEPQWPLVSEEIAKEDHPEDERLRQELIHIALSELKLILLEVLRR